MRVYHAQQLSVVILVTSLQIKATMLQTLSPLFLLLCATSVIAYKSYQSRIPNGERVHHPCFPNQFWQGVGHFTKQGGNARNLFGEDFAKADHQWTRDLCMKDSDGDGRSNGDELGDPNCSWSPGKTPMRVTNISHPGVCQPMTSANCKKRNGAWNICVPNKLVCPPIQGPNVTNITLRFTRTQIPSKVTNYYCQAFKLPIDKDYHLIAHEPLIDNAEVMHHALVFGCEKEPQTSHFTAPYTCGMGGSTCQQLIGIWGLGSPGQCFPKQFGIKFGRTGYKHIVIQFHWNNVGQRSDLYDASAIRFYLTSKLRENEGAIIIAGQRYLELPPGKALVTQEGKCTSDCTSLVRHAINITTVFPHMHYAGKFAEAYQYRKGKKVRDLLKYTAVVYDEPMQKSFPEPIDFLPGDEIRMKCHYKTTDNKHTLYYGDSTQDEMCFLFLSYYPATKFPLCLSYGPVDMCGIYLPKNGGTGILPGNIDKCNVAQFLTVRYRKKWAPMLDEFCDYSISACRSGCMTVLKKMIAEEPCWNGWAKKFLEFRALFDMEVGKLRLQVGRCEAELERMQQKPPTASPSRQKGLDEMQTILISVGCGVVLILILAVTIFGILKATGANRGNPREKLTTLDFNDKADSCANKAYVYDGDNTQF